MDAEVEAFLSVQWHMNVATLDPDGWSHSAWIRPSATPGRPLRRVIEGAGYEVAS